jgi:hypothetical protein
VSERDPDSPVSVDLYVPLGTNEVSLDEGFGVVAGDVADAAAAGVYRLSL